MAQQNLLSPDKRGYRASEIEPKADVR